MRSTESTISLVDFNAHIGTDSEAWKSIIGRHEVPALNENGLYLLQLRCSNGLCITNTFLLFRSITQPRTALLPFGLHQRSLCCYFHYADDPESLSFRVVQLLQVQFYKKVRNKMDFDIFNVYKQFQNLNVCVLVKGQ